MTYYKVVQSHTGLTIAHLTLPEGASICRPKMCDDSRVRGSAFLVEWIENNSTMGWGPVDKRTVYAIGEVTETDTFNSDPSIVSGPGLHAFTEKNDASEWMRTADI